MEPYIDEMLVHNFKSRMLMRLHLTQSSIAVLEAELAEMKTFLLAIPQDIFAKKDAENFIEPFTDKTNNSQIQLQSAIEEIETLAQITWQEMAELQEKFLGVFILSYEQPLEIRRQFTELMQSITDKALKKAKSASRKKAPVVTQPNPVKDYSTPSMAAMQAAIQEFWLNHNPNKPPTQKQVSNFIADQLGEPIKNRMTDELARAIKPEGIK